MGHLVWIDPKEVSRPSCFHVRRPNLHPGIRFAIQYALLRLFGSPSIDSPKFGCDLISPRFILHCPSGMFGKCSSITSPRGIDASTVFASDSMPFFGLSCDSNFKFRVYVVRTHCKRLYVGIEEKSKIGERLTKHWDGAGSHFLQVYKPKDILLVYPAAQAACEAYVFNCLLSVLPTSDLSRIGGWTQTSSAPSPELSFGPSFP